MYVYIHIYLYGYLNIHIYAYLRICIYICVEKNTHAFIRKCSYKCLNILIQVGMPLGEWSAILRVQQQLVFEHYPQRKDMLNSLEYAWWLPPGHIPQKYFRSVK
jgi:hypothetical protein